MSQVFLWNPFQAPVKKVVFLRVCIICIMYSIFNKIIFTLIIMMIIIHGIIK